MKRLATLACISMFAAIISCQRSDDNLPAPRSTKATTARELFDRQSHALPNTKSTAAAEDIVRPMPIGMAPLWDKAIETPYSDGVAITIPVGSTVGYLATYPCSGHDHGDEHAHHAEQSVVVTQKLVVLMPARGGDSLCYVVNIVPYADCDLSNAALAEGFAYGGSFVGFSGFAAYHRLDGTLSHIDSYNKGTVASTALPGDNEAISLVTRNARLFIENRMQTKANDPYDFDPNTAICNKCYTRCGSAYSNAIAATTIDYSNPEKRRKYELNVTNGSLHCSMCNKLKSGRPGSTSYCQCTTPPTCPVCGIPNCKTNHQGGCPICGMPDCPIIGQHPGICPVCKLQGCTTDHSSSSSTCLYCGIQCTNKVVNTSPTPPNHQRSMLFDALYNHVVSTSLHLIQEGSYALEVNRRSQGDEFYHNLLATSETYTTARAKLQNHFVGIVRGYKNYGGNSVRNLGEAMHSLLDYFVPTTDRQSSLNYYTYVSYTNIVQSMGSATSSARNLYNAIQALPQYPTDDQIVAVFNNWCNGGNET